MTNITISTGSYDPALYRRGLPYRINGGADFVLKSVCKSVTFGSNVHGGQGQENHFRVAMQDDPGWLMYILASGTLDKAKHIAANIMMHYHTDEGNTFWIQNVGEFKFRPSTSLFVFDSMFEDDTAYRRSMFYEAIQKADGPRTSIIVLGRADDPNTFIKHLGMKPNLLIYTK